MAILQNITTDRTNQQNQTGALDALVIEEYTGIINGTIERRSLMTPFMKPRTIKGTTTITSYAQGKVGGVVAITPGVTPDAQTSDKSRMTLTVDKMLIQREYLFSLEEFQTVYNARQAIGQEQAKEVAKFIDQMYFIQANKAARLTDSAYAAGSPGKPSGFYGGSQITIPTASVTDPAILFQKFVDLLVAMKGKDVDPANDGVVLVLAPAEYHALAQSEYLINRDYVTSDGNKLQGMDLLKGHGVPILWSNNFKDTCTNITSHPLGSRYVTDLSDTVAIAVSERALLSGVSKAVTTEVWEDKFSKGTFLDVFFAMDCTPDRAEYAAVMRKV